jgi:class 3 adenylate cyclase/pimeloyl-ACP methyl ester carboxylesterase
MSDERLRRRLAAILATDMVGYSRLIEADETGTIARQKAYRRELIDPAIAEHGGRVVATSGDGLLAEFASVIGAVECAVSIQQAMDAREADVPEDRRIRFRTGINLGDIVIDGEDILGDGVNVAARLQALAEPGGICVSDIVRQSVDGKLALAFEDLGETMLKNIARPVRVWKWRPARVAASPRAAPAAREQEIRFCTAADGTRLAYSVVGEGPPLVMAGVWYTHLELDWGGSVYRRLLHELSRDFRVVRYDQRGTGLSQRDVADISFDAWVGDLGTVVDAAALDRFALLGISQGAPVSIAYAARHPHRLTHLILHGGYARGWLVSGDNALGEQQHQALLTLIRQGWGRRLPTFRRMFTTILMPGGTDEQFAAANEVERLSASPDTAARIFDVIPRVDVSGLLPDIRVPTLVTHSRDDSAILHKAGQKTASMISGARFVTLDSRNHVPLDHEPAFERFLAGIRSFLRDVR